MEGNLGVHCTISLPFLYTIFPKKVGGKRKDWEEREWKQIQTPFPMVLLQRKQRNGELEGNVRVADKFLSLERVQLIVRMQRKISMN